MYKGQPFDFRGEIYTFGMDTWSRENLHILTSIDYSKMSDADKAKENFPRSDHDYGMSWIRREGNGRVFYWPSGTKRRRSSSNRSTSSSSRACNTRSAT